MTDYETNFKDELAKYIIEDINTYPSDTIEIYNFNNVSLPHSLQRYYNMTMSMISFQYYPTKLFIHVDRMEGDYSIQFNDLNTLYYIDYDEFKNILYEYISLDILFLVYYTLPLNFTNFIYKNDQRVLNHEHKRLKYVAILLELIPEFSVDYDEIMISTDYFPINKFYINYILNILSGIYIFERENVSKISFKYEAGRLDYKVIISPLINYTITINNLDEIFPIVDELISHQVFLQRNNQNYISINIDDPTIKYYNMQSDEFLGSRRIELSQRTGL